MTNQNFFQVGNHVTFNGQQYSIIEHLPGKILVERIGSQVKKIRAFRYKLMSSEFVMITTEPFGLWPALGRKRGVS